MQAIVVKEVSMNGRDRILRILSRQTVDRPAFDLGGTDCSGIHVARNQQYSVGGLPQMCRRQPSRCSLLRLFSRTISVATWRLVPGTVTRTFSRPFVS